MRYDRSGLLRINLLAMEILGSRSVRWTSESYLCISSHPMWTSTVVKTRCLCAYKVLSTLGRQCWVMLVVLSRCAVLSRYLFVQRLYFNDKWYQGEATELCHTIVLFFQPKTLVLPVSRHGNGPDVWSTVGTTGVFKNNTRLLPTKE